MCGLHTHFGLSRLKCQACEIHTILKKTRKQAVRNIVGSQVRRARLQLSPAVSQDDLSGRLARQGIILDRSAISRIESQSRYVMDYEAKALAKCLHVSVDWLFGER